MLFKCFEYLCNKLNKPKNDSLVVSSNFFNIQTIYIIFNQFTIIPGLDSFSYYTYFSFFFRVLPTAASVANSFAYVLYIHFFFLFCVSVPYFFFFKEWEWATHSFFFLLFFFYILDGGKKFIIVVAFLRSRKIQYFYIFFFFFCVLALCSLCFPSYRILCILCCLWRKTETQKQQQARNTEYM